MGVRWVGFPSSTSGKESVCNAGDTRDKHLITGIGRSPAEGNGNPLQYSCLENSMDRGVWQATVKGVTKSRTQLSTHTCTMVRWNILLSPGKRHPELSGKGRIMKKSRPTQCKFCQHSSLLLFMDKSQCIFWVLSSGKTESFSWETQFFMNINNLKNFCSYFLYPNSIFQH